jgi:broad specificity phosphatase PhoE
VAHGGAIRAALSLLLEIDPALLVPVTPASLTIISRTAKRPRLQSYNVTPEGADIDPPD